MVMRKLTLTAAVVASLTACESQSGPTGPEGALQPSFSVGPAEMNRALAAARSATARFHDVTAALADGYLNTGHCVDSPAGGMGIHFIKPTRLDAGWTAAEPEMLLYEPQANGSMKLVGIEYAVVVPLWHAAGNDGVPELAGQLFDFMPADEASGRPPLYTLHAWVWQHNPAGMFQPFNARVSCGAMIGHDSH